MARAEADAHIDSPRRSEARQRSIFEIPDRYFEPTVPEEDAHSLTADAARAALGLPPREPDAWPSPRLANMLTVWARMLLLLLPTLALVMAPGLLERAATPLAAAPGPP